MDVNHTFVVPEDGDNRRFKTISSAGTTSTIPAIFEDPEMPNHFFLGSHHHEAIGVRGAPVPLKVPAAPGGLLYNVIRCSSDNYPSDVKPSHPRNLRKPLMYEARKPLKQYPLRMPYTDTNDEVSFLKCYRTD